MADVESGTAVVLLQIEGIRSNIGSAGSVAVSVIQRVLAEEGEFRAHSNAAVYDQLVLLEDTFGLKLIVNLARRGNRSCAGRNLLRISEVGEKLMIAARVEVRDGEIGGPG